jgi:ATP-dependent protease ClpP protease subunit
MRKCPACQQSSISIVKILSAWRNKVNCPQCGATVGAKRLWAWSTGLVLALLAGEISVIMLPLPVQTQVWLLLLGLFAFLAAYVLVFSLFARLEVKADDGRDAVYRPFVYGALVGVLLSVAFLSGTITGFYLQAKGSNTREPDRVYGGDAINNAIDTQSLQQGEIYLSGYITGNNYRYIPLAIRRLNETDTTKPITLLINSTGGDLGAAYAIVNEIARSKAPVKTIASAYCGSAALVVLLNGTGPRYAYRNTKFFFHSDMFVDGRGKIEDTLGYRIYRDAHRRANLPGEWFRVSTSRWFGVDEARRYGLVDSIL